MALKLRQGLSTDRTTITPESGELLYTTDTKALYVGDGATAGGNAISGGGGGSGTVTSVGGTGTVSGISLSGTVTTSGNLTLGGTLAVTPSNFASQTANTVLSAPNGTNGTPTFRSLVSADIPTLNQNTTGTAANVTGVVAVANGGTGTTTPALVAGTNVTITGTWPNQTIAASGGGGSGTVTSISVASANGFAGSVANSTTTPAITVSTSITGVLKGNGTAISAASAGTDYQAPITLTTTGTSGAATFSGNTLNIPQYSGGGGSGTVTSVNATVPAFLSVSGNPITTSGTLAISYSGTALPIANGGTGQTTAAAAITALTGTQTSGHYLRSSGTSASLSAIQAADVPTLNQNTTGTAANVTGTVAIANGGTGETTQQAALNALAGSVQNSRFLAGNGVNVTMRAIAVVDVPTLNQNTTGTAANVTGTVAIANGGTAVTAAPTNGQLLIGNGTGYTLSTLTAGSNITITNTSGAITIAATGGGSGITTGKSIAMAMIFGY